MSLRGDTYGAVKDENEQQLGRDCELVAHLRRVCKHLDETAALLTAGHDGELLAYDGELLARTVHEAGDLLGGAAAALRARAELDGPR